MEVLYPGLKGLPDINHFHRRLFVTTDVNLCKPRKKNKDVTGFFTGYNLNDFSQSYGF